MKKIYTIILFPLLISGCFYKNDKPATPQMEQTEDIITVQPATKQRDVFLVEKASSTVEWQLGDATGDIQIQSGSIILINNIPVDGTLTLNLNTINSSNTTTANAMKSENFFDSATYPKTTFVITKIEALEPANDYSQPTDVKIMGNLMIKNTTKGITFPASISVLGDTARMEAKFSLDLNEWVQKNVLTKEKINLSILLNFTK